MKLCVDLLISLMIVTLLVRYKVVLRLHLNPRHRGDRLLMTSRCQHVCRVRRGWNVVWNWSCVPSHVNIIHTNTHTQLSQLSMDGF